MAIEVRAADRTLLTHEVGVAARELRAGSPATCYHADTIATALLTITDHSELPSCRAAELPACFAE